MAALAKGVSLSFGLINASVSVHNALEAKVSNTSVCTGTRGHTHTATKIAQRRQCAECVAHQKANRTPEIDALDMLGEVAYEDVKKAREVAGGYVVFDDAEIKGARVDAEKHKKLASLTPHPAEDVESGTVPGGKLYHLTPEAGAEQGYAVLRHLVRTHPELTFMALWTPRSSAGVFALRARGDVLVLQERVPAAATKASPAVTADAPVALLAMADQLLSIDNIVTAFDPDLYADSYEANLQAILATKAAVPAGTAPSAPTATAGNDLMASLAAFVAASAAPVAETKKKAPVKKKKVAA